MKLQWLLWLRTCLSIKILSLYGHYFLSIFFFGWAYSLMSEKRVCQNFILSFVEDPQKSIFSQIVLTNAHRLQTPSACNLLLLIISMHIGCQKWPKSLFNYKKIIQHEVNLKENKMRGQGRNHTRTCFHYLYLSFMPSSFLIFYHCAIPFVLSHIIWYSWNIPEAGNMTA